MLSKAVNGWVSFLLQTAKVTSHAIKGGWGILRIFPYWVSAFLQLREWPLHAYAINRTSLFLSSFATEEATDPAIDHTSLDPFSLVLVLNAAWTIFMLTERCLWLLKSHGCKLTLSGEWEIEKLTVAIWNNVVIFLMLFCYGPFEKLKGFIWMFFLLLLLLLLLFLSMSWFVYYINILILFHNYLDITFSYFMGVYFFTFLFFFISFSL